MGKVVLPLERWVRVGVFGLIVLGVAMLAKTSVLGPHQNFRIQSAPSNPPFRRSS